MKIPLSIIECLNQTLFDLFVDASGLEFTSEFSGQCPQDPNCQPPFDSAQSVQAKSQQKIRSALATVVLVVKVFGRQERFEAIGTPGNFVPIGLVVGGFYQVIDPVPQPVDAVPATCNGYWNWKGDR
jgi:hypothetical protein